MDHFKVSIGCDHAGLETAKKLSVWLFDKGCAVLTFFPPDNKRVDYPEYARKTCQSVLLDSHTISRGILVCGTGVGMAIAANRFTGIRCVNSHDLTIVRLAREHNDANVLSLGSRFISDEHAWKCAETFLESYYEGGRHEQRVMQLFEVQT